MRERGTRLGPEGVSRRGFLGRGAGACAAWAGTGVLYSVAGGVPRARLIDEAGAAPSSADLTFLHISDSHVGFDKPANPDALGTLREAIAKAKNLPVRPAFAIHTGDVSHLSRDSQFDDADQLLRELNMPVVYVPGEHDVVDESNGKAFLARYGRDTKGDGWRSFDQGGVHFVGLVNVLNFKAGGAGLLGEDQLAWLHDDLKAVSSSTPVVVYTHIPLWTIYDPWGWKTEDSGRTMAELRRFGSVTILNGHIHQIISKVEGNIAFHTAASTAFPQPAPGTAPNPGPLKVPAGELRAHLGIREVQWFRGTRPLAVTETSLDQTA